MLGIRRVETLVSRMITPVIISPGEPATWPAFQPPSCTEDGAALQSETKMSVAQSSFSCEVDTLTEEARRGSEPSKIEAS